MPNGDGTMMSSTQVEQISAEEKMIRVQMDDLSRIRKEMVNFKKTIQEQRTKRLLHRRLKRIEALRVEIVGRHRKIVQFSVDQSDDYFTEEIFDLFENEYLEVVAAIETMIDEMYPDSESVNQTNSTSATEQPIETIARQVTYNITNDVPFKLPELTIPTFDGEYRDWPAFYDAFLQIHNHPKLTTNQKFTYLKVALSPRVKTFIGWLDITAENYEETLAELKKRYNSKRVLFNSHMDHFMKQPQLAQESPDGFQLLHDVSRSCQMAFRKLDIYSEECGAFLAYLIIAKLPHSSRIEWEKELGKSTDIPTLEQILDFLDTRFRTLEAVYPQSKKNSHKPSPSQASISNRKEIKSFHVASKGLSCPMCSQSHALRKCSRFLQIGPHERKSFVDKSKLCVNCLGHSADTACSSTRTCFTCGGKHHTLLHFHKITNQVSSFNPRATTFQPNAQTVPNVANTTSTTAAVNLVSASSKTILLTTALVDVPDINGQLIRLRALVDQCSQHSIITTRAAQRLKLRSIPICVGIRPMGETQYKIANKGLNLDIHSIVDKDYSIQTTVAIIPTISTDLPLFPVKTNEWPHLQSLPLADPSYATPGQIDLLLAGEVYFSIVQSGICKGQEGELVAINTSLGWLLGGELCQQKHVTAMP
ncbi:uncharacterized protein LOC129572915, partial [Sitodiplosis mosellana]|uniref:uncharacterized protein LOC129572915 n=1 Tax=Sitodiplosis mosellana TaxID=263140 RepID=UPI00244471F2